MIRTITLIFAFAILTLSATSQLRYMKKGKIKTSFNFDYATSSSYYNLDGDLRIYERDTFNIIIEDSIPYQYILKHTYELKEYHFNPYIEYALDDDFILYLDIPLVYKTYTNKYENDTNSYSPTFGRQTIREQYSTFYPAYYGFGGYIRLNKGIITSSLLFGGQLPQKLKNGYQQDTTDNFYIYNTYKFHLGLVSTLMMEKGFLELETTYQYRSGDFADYFHLGLEGGFTTVPNTALKGLVVYNINLSGFDNAQAVNPRLTTLQEDALFAGAAFEAIIENKVFIEFAYLISLGLTNTLSYGTLQINTSVILN